jgi:hypothetical protein
MPNDFQKNNLSAKRTTTLASRTRLFQAIRYSPKNVRQRRPDDNGCCVCNVKSTRRVLYRLSQMLRALVADAERRV